jgi:hypothetical protein
MKSFENKMEHYKAKSTKFRLSYRSYISQSKYSNHHTKRKASENHKTAALLTTITTSQYPYQGNGKAL